MGKIINIADYKSSKQLEEEYQKFLVYVNKRMGLPLDFGKLTLIFYCTLRYLEGTVNCMGILPLTKKIDERLWRELLEHIITWLEGIVEDLKSMR